ncbi:HTTM domain-containing protein [Streptomyces iconiensis]|uniref:HTTM domain-containing protein n=1 Tax=Streptomyces iconiensis TaxID=1384038 RepID=A0ABT6ZRB0_9ACTN|nr:HTTM domain-containing protein [Streptomyces iconiensis]MDJ1131601.1 HTTM domain-containing protein [Streptomyces iconiensis]
MTDQGRYMAVGSPRARVERSVSRGLARITAHALGPYQTAIVRIGFGATWLFFLLREWPHREELYGPSGPWSWGMAERLIDSNQAFSVLMWSGSDSWFQLVYLVALASSAALMLGWHTRASSVLFMVGVLSLQNRSVFMGDGGDNVIHLMSLYLMLTRCGQVWSLDARRAARLRERGMSAHARGVGGTVLWAVLGAVLLGGTVAGGFTLGWGLFFWALWAVYGLWWLLNRLAADGGHRVREFRDVCDILANLAHNGALLIIMVEVCLIYSTAGWFKIQGSRWQDGTAVYYPMHLDYFAPWPDLNQVLAGSGLMIFLITYGTVAVQVAFPFALFNRRVKNVLLAMMIVEHLSIAFLLGLPFFSMAMIAADMVFLPTVFLLWAGRHASGITGRLGRRLPGAGRGKRTDDQEARGDGPEAGLDTGPGTGRRGGATSGSGAAVASEDGGGSGQGGSQETVERSDGAPAESGDGPSSLHARR